jgi:hypothetical protein
MTQPTPTERIVLFPEPLRDRHSGGRKAAVLCLFAAVIAAGWFLARDQVVRWVGVGSELVSEATGGEKPAPVPASPVTSHAQTTPTRSAPTPPPVSQSPARVDSGVDAFAEDRFEAAATQLRRAVNGRGVDSLDENQRARALTFLGAAELMRGRRDSATSAFRRLLAVNPRRPPDPAVFAPTVVDLYDQLRSKQNGVARIATTPEGVALTIVALTPHRLSVGVGQNGRPTSFQLFDGVVSDSVVVTWDGFSPGGAPSRPGTYELVLVAFPADGGARRSVRFPVLVERETATGDIRARVPGSLPGPADRSSGDGRQLLP